MSDNVPTTAATGSGQIPISTEDNGSGVQLPRSKIMIGAHGTDGGDVSATNPFPTQPSQGGAATSATNGAPSALVDNAGNVLGVAAHPVRTDPTGTTTQPISGAVTVSGSPTVTQGTAAALAGAWPVELTDGTHTMPTGDAAARAVFEKVTDGTNTMAVKAASTAAVAADPAAVVSLSPNSPIAYPTRSYSSVLGAASSVVKASSGTLFSLKLRNRNVSARYAFLYNLTAKPADGAESPLDILLVPPSSMLIVGSDYFTASGIGFGTGITVVMSATDSSTQTTGTASDHDIAAVFS